MKTPTQTLKDSDDMDDDIEALKERMNVIEARIADLEEQASESDDYIEALFARVNEQNKGRP
jgi:hypothetical protein